MVEGVSCSGCILDKKRFTGCDLVQPIEVVDSVICHSGDHVPFMLAIKWIDLSGITEQVWLPLVGITADKTIEVLKTHTGWPKIKRPGHTGGKSRNIVIFTKPRSGIAVVKQDTTNRRLILSIDAVVTWVSR